MSPYDRKCGRCDQIIFEHNKRAIWGNEIICASCYDEARYVESSGYKPVETEHKGGIVSGDIKAEFHRDFVLTYAQAKQLEKLAESITKLMTEIKAPALCEWCGAPIPHYHEGKICVPCAKEYLGKGEDE